MRPSTQLLYCHYCILDRPNVSEPHRCPSGVSSLCAWLQHDVHTDTYIGWILVPQLVPSTTEMHTRPAVLAR
jgi:hypothetical protein